MRFLLAFVLSFVSLFAIAQAPPMALGGPQGITSTRINAQSWLSIPVYVDTPAAPLVGIGWPPRGFMIQTIKNYRDATVEEYLSWAESAGLTQVGPITWQSTDGTIYTLPEGIDSSQVASYILAGDTAIWHYTGRQWKRVGGNAEFYFNSLISGGFVNQVAPVSSRKFTISAVEYIISGVKYKYDTTQTLIAPSKVADSTGRIDVIVLRSYGAVLLKGTTSTVPLKPRVGGDEIELTSIYYAPFSTVPSVIGSGSKGISSIFRVPGKDSIFYTVDTLKFAIKDSIGVSKSDTASMLNNYKFTAANGLTKDSTVFRLGGSLNQNTSINLNTRRLTIIGGLDTTRFFAGGQVSIGGTPDSNTVHHLVNRKNSRLGNLEILSGASASITGAGIRVDGADQTFKFQGSSQSGTGTTFQFVSWPGDTVPANTGQPHLSRDIIRISQGFVRQSYFQAIDTGRYNVLNIEPKYNIWYDSGRTLIRGIYYNPTIQALNKTTHIAYQNNTGSNWLNSKSGNTKIGYNSIITNAANDTAYKLDINGNMRVVSGRIFYGTDTTDVPIVIRKAWSGATTPGVNIGYNTLMSNNTNSYMVSDRTELTGGSNTVNVIGYLNNIDSSISCTVIGGGNTIPNPSSHQIILGYSNISNSYSNTQNASIVIGLGNNTNGYWGSGLIGSSLKYYEDGALAFGGNSNNVNFATRNVYFGNGVKNENNNTNSNFGNGPDVAINPSWANDVDSINRNGGSLTIAGGRGTGTGTPGTVRFSTWNSTTSGSTLHPTLTERARISPAGNLLVGTATDVPSSKLTVTSTTQGFLPPRMTGAQAELISSPAEGLMIYSTDGSGTTITSKGWWGYNGTAWVKLN